MSMGELVFDGVAISGTRTEVRPLGLAHGGEYQGAAGGGQECAQGGGGAVAMYGGTVTFKGGSSITGTTAVCFAKPMRARVHSQAQACTRSHTHKRQTIHTDAHACNHTNTHT
jgi:hypothetical protein